MWLDFVELVYFFLIIAIAVTFGVEFWPAIQLWTIVICIAILLGGFVLGYWLFEAKREEQPQ